MAATRHAGISLSRRGSLPALSTAGLLADGQLAPIAATALSCIVVN